MDYEKSIETEKIDFVEFIRTTPIPEASNADITAQLSTETHSTQMTKTSNQYTRPKSFNSLEDSTDCTKTSSHMKSILKTNPDIRPFKKTLSSSRLRTMTMISTKFHSLDLTETDFPEASTTDNTQPDDIIHLPVIEGLQIANDNSDCKSKENLKSGAEAHKHIKIEKG
uniref:Uncharacterized protein n=1 Tax=Syphacia muris TaxID=451379 RepID=A0A0N5AXQ7_9BILA